MLKFVEENSKNEHMKRFPEPQHFFAAAWQNWDLRSSEEGPKQTLFKHFLSYFQNIGLVEPGFEPLHGQSWIVVNWQFM